MLQVQIILNKVLAKILMLNTERGDKVNFVFEDFPVKKIQDEVQVGLPIEAKLMIFVLIITSLFLIVYILLKIKQLKLNQQILLLMKRGVLRNIDQEIEREDVLIGGKHYPLVVI